VAFNGEADTSEEDATHSLWNTVNLRVGGIDGQELAEVLNLDHQIAVSVGSACSSGKQQHHSHVLAAMGLTEQEIESSIRISFGKVTTGEEIDYLAQSIEKAVNSLKLYTV